MAENKSPRRLSNVLPVMAALLLVCVHGFRAQCNPPCQNGFCIGFSCLCSPFFHGRRCEIAATCTPPCKNGTCMIENRCQCQEEFVGDRCEIEACKVPLSPRNGNMTCSDKHYDMHRRPQKTCTAECEKGYQFPNGENEVELVCPFRANAWRPRSEFPDCEAVCDPPCQNGGTCREGHQCVCHTGFEGERCENDICKVPPSPANGNIICVNSTDDRIRKMCTAECEEGYKFPNGENEVLHICDLEAKVWRPRYEFPDCEAVCNPPCQNGGTCGEGNQCVCPKGFDGETCGNAIRCQYPGTPENGVRLSSHYPVGSRIRFGCNADYELKGAEEILCRANGQWEGEITTCDLPDVCSLNPCRNGGNCTALSEGVTCECREGFKGADCSIEIPFPPTSTLVSTPTATGNLTSFWTHLPTANETNNFTRTTGPTSWTFLPTSTAESSSGDHSFNFTNEVESTARNSTSGPTTSTEYSQCGRGKEKVGVGSRRIVFGQPVTEPWPWMAALYMKKSQEGTEKTIQGGGSLIHPHFVLTVGSLMYGIDGLRKPSDITVKLGLVHVNDTEHVQQMEVRKIHIHNNFVRRTSVYDAALLELKEPILHNSRVFPICLPPKDIPADSPFYKRQSKVWIASWGSVERRTHFDDFFPRTSDVLMEFELDIQPREICRKRFERDYRMIFTDDMFCAGPRGVMRERCRGERGGPVMQQDLKEADNKSWTQVGLHSEMAMYTHIHQLMPWIDEIIRKAEKGN